ncbi:MAG: chromosome segregation protein SMC [Deltaproteobacteria bacterium]|nr:chromosome segregation protein SMC [Deltaproteobacteria bacterium]
MRLKNLEIIGFKSFRDKVVLDFSDGITAVVGPNGCGKSNIVDAIRWVMGEQRVKTLRGKKMDDVIFHGAEAAAPIGMAEVSMIIENNGHSFSGTYADCSEVMISRRLFRDGESEYTINKVPCRLLDVREFFMGTGVGAKTYSIVEQNNVASLVEAKPEERRQFIEDAAGISKYKSRKEAASRKMEATRQNILRLNDIIKEVKTQLNAVSRQAKRAEQYRELKKQVKEAEITLALQVHADLSAKGESLKESRAVLDRRDMEIRTNLKGLEAAFEGLKVEILENEEKLSGCQKKLYDVRNIINIEEQKIEYTKGHIKDLSERKQKNLSEVEILRERQENVTGEIEVLKTVTGESDDKIENVRHAVSQSQMRVEELKKEADALHRDLEEKKVEYIDIVTGKAKAKNMLISLEKRIEDLRKRADRDNREIYEHRERLDSILHDIEQLRTELKSDEDSLEELRERKTVAGNECERSKRELEELDEEISERKEEAGRKSTRLTSLKEFQESYAWCNEGIKSIMTADKKAGSETTLRNACIGLVADHIDVPREYETAVEAVLGEKLQYVVVKSQEDGVRAIDYLKSYSLGRGSFVPLEVRNNGLDSKPADHLQEAVRLIDLVNVQQDFKKIADYLLGDVLLIPNLNRGISLWEMNGFRGTFVTPEGDIITPQGVLTGGSKTNGERSLLQNKREIAELEAEAENLTARLEKDRENRKRMVSLISEWEEELLQSGSDIHHLELRINGKKKDMERFEDDIRRTEQRIHVLEFSHENLKSEETETLERIDAVKQEISSYENREKSINDVTSSSRNEWETLKTRLEGQEKELTEQKILLTSLEGKRDANIRTLSKLHTDIVGLSSEIDAKMKDIGSCESQAESMAKEIQGGKDLLEKLYRDYETLEETLTQSKILQQEREASLRKGEAEIREVRQACDKIVQEINELEMENREISYQMDGLTKNIEGKYYVNLGALIPDFRKLDEQEIEKLTTRLAGDRQSIENFGEVNLLALTEYDQIKERFDFLTGQVSDLNTSLDALQRTITRINQISRKRFAETFEAVNRRFKEVFSRIFPGGKGNLRLTDETDLLETGVDIDIVIPGKRAQSISLLSGGEKSLAAIALIFSILLYRPAPFLVLDEVDAALDDANISLFNHLVKDTAANSQIIMVTHNKRTMEFAENLFGITMQKQGISTVVSVALN